LVLKDRLEFDWPYTDATPEAQPPLYKMQDPAKRITENRLLMRFSVNCRKKMLHAPK